MLPTFEDNNRVIVSKVSMIDRFDLIVFMPLMQQINTLKGSSEYPEIVLR